MINVVAQACAEPWNPPFLRLTTVLSVMFQTRYNQWTSGITGYILTIANQKQA